MLHADNVDSVYASQDAMRVFVSLDAIFDLRLAAMMLLHPDIAFLASTDNNYYSRKVDNYSEPTIGTVDKAMVDSICEKFKYEIIQAAEYTRLLEVIQDYSISYFKKAITGPLPNVLEYTINLEGCPFTDEQVKEMGEKIYAQVKGLDVQISFISIPLNQVKFSELEVQYDAYYVYNWHVLHNNNVDELKTRKYRNTIIYAPKVLSMRLPTKEEYKSFIELRMDMFKAASLEIAPYLRLEFLPIEYYCAMTPFNNIGFEAQSAAKK